ncbi:hypothetical protein BC938DRAFT_481076 [Jimgerdemannia flammicorona]|uniref:Uncharacterized protein n=1 Tax=Jimgerdemannia flammicorona TaxID=994334 RepID=A0A433QX70_9FUNG|nr:hypothetical protein BC938DRAFT_481076 [Jimgerdemannia flammicorona]
MGTRRTKGEGIKPRLAVPVTVGVGNFMGPYEAAVLIEDAAGEMFGTEMTELTGAELTGAEMTGAEMTEAEMTAADVTRSEVTAADVLVSVTAL